ncbi:MAG: hypothetical protein H6Q56_1769 [Deltaproteobacteria bacterium]|nr:hypothetical protein [Deltaproteobacteria bacterium]
MAGWYADFPEKRDEQGNRSHAVHIIITMHADGFTALFGRQETQHGFCHPFCLQRVTKLCQRRVEKFLRLQFCVKPSCDKQPGMKQRQGKLPCQSADSRFIDRF